MSTYDLPAALLPQVASFGLQKTGVQFKSPFDGSIQSVSFAGWRWTASITTTPKSLASSGAVEAFANLMAGGINRVRMRHPARRQPAGTLRGSPLMAAGASVGNQSIILGGCTVGATLLPGDMIGPTGGDQLWQVATAATADADGYMVVPLVNRVRTGVPLFTAVSWYQPTTLFLCQSMMNTTVFRPGYSEGVALDFIEWWDATDLGTVGLLGMLFLDDSPILLDNEYLELL